MKQKNYNLELVRLISFIMVVLIHVSNYFCRDFEYISRSEYIFSLILNTLSRVSVPCFFMISGALLMGRTETYTKALKRAYQFLVVLVIWSVIYYVFNIYYMNQKVDVAHILSKPAEAHLWYLYVMIPIYLALPFLQAMVRGLTPNLEKALVIVGGIWILLLKIGPSLSLNFYFDLPIFGRDYYLYYLFLGHFIVKYKDKIPHNVPLWLSLYLGTSLINVVVVTRMSILDGDHTYPTLSYGGVPILLSSVAFFILAIQFRQGNYQPSPKTKYWIDAGCSCSFGIYLIHILFLDNFKKHVEAYDVTSYWGVPVLTIVILLVSFACVYAYHKVISLFTKKENH